MLAAAMTAVVWGWAAPQSQAAAERAGDLSAVTLERGSGYAEGGSEAVRRLQVRLRRLGHAPGPIDGLFGPLTEGAVERFQGARGLAVDGVVGPKTRARLLPHPGGQRSAPGTAAKSAAAESRRAATERDRAAPDPQPAGRLAQLVPVEPAPTPEPESSTSFSSGFVPLLLAAAAAFLLLGAWALMRRQRRATRARGDGPPAVTRSPGVNVGLLCAGVLAGFVIGAAAGALFATEAGPDSSAEHAQVKLER